MKETISQKITLDDLAAMVQRGFRETDTKIVELRNDMNDGFDRIDARFDHLESKFDAVEKKVFKDHEPRIRRVEKKLQIA